MNRRQTIPKELRYTRNQFDKDFPNDDTCLARIIRVFKDKRSLLCYKHVVETMFA